MAVTSLTSYFNTASFGDGNAYTRNQQELALTLDSAAHELANWKTLLSMSAGGGAFELGKFAATTCLSSVPVLCAIPVLTNAFTFVAGAVADTGLTGLVNQFLEGHEGEENETFLDRLTSQGSVRAMGLVGAGQNFAVIQVLIGLASVSHGMLSEKSSKSPADGAFLSSILQGLQCHFGSGMFTVLTRGTVNAVEERIKLRTRNINHPINPLSLLKMPNLASAVGPRLAWAGGLSAHDQKPILMAHNPGLSPENIGGASGEASKPAHTPKESDPPPPYHSFSPPPANPGKTPSVLERVMGGFVWLGTKFNLNAWVDLERAPYSRVRTQVPAAPPRSIAEMMARHEVAGLNRRALAFLRWGAHQLRETPKARQAFFEQMSKIFEAQARLRTALAPILERLPFPDLSPLSRAAEPYNRALEDLNPHAGRYLAEALLLEENLRGIKTPKDYLSLTDAAIRDMGLVPEGVHAIGRNAHAFSRQQWEQILDHPLLRDLPETAALREPLRVYHEETLPALQRDLQRANEVTLAGLRAQLNQTQDIAQRKDLERMILSISNDINRQYKTSVDRFNRRVREFLEDPLRARVVFLENARLASIVRGVQNISPAQMAEWIGARLEDLPPTGRKTAQALLACVGELELISRRSLRSRLYHGIARVFDRDPHPPLQVRGRYERLLIQLLTRDAPLNFWRLETLPIALQGNPSCLAAAREAQQNYFRVYHPLAEQIRSTLAALEEANQQFWKTHDTGEAELILSDLKLQLSQVEEQRSRLGNHFDRQTEYAAKLALAMSTLATFENPETRGKNSREINRSVEAALQAIAKARAEVRKALKARKLPGADFRGVSTVMAPYVDRTDSSLTTRLGESLRVAWPLALHTPPAVSRLVSSVTRQDTVAVADRFFLGWAMDMSSHQDVFVMDPALSQILDGDPVVLAGAHNSWFDFGRGPTPAARGVVHNGAASLRRRLWYLRNILSSPPSLNGHLSHRNAVRILAKKGLDKLVGPVLEVGIRLLTEVVGDSILEFDTSVTHAAEAMAFGDLHSHRLLPRSAAAYDELTMSVRALLSPFAYDPFQDISSLLEVAQGGRSFNIADRALAFTGRPQSVMFTVSRNAYVSFPKPDKPGLPWRHGPLTTVTQFLPYASVWDLATPALRTRRAGEARANWLRTYWLVMGTLPEYCQPIASIERMFEPFDAPVDLATERTLETRFGAALGVYPSARDSYESRWVETHLERAELTLQEAKTARADAHDRREVQRLIHRRRQILGKFARAQERNESLDEVTAREWNALKASIAGKTAVAETVERVETFEREVKKLTPTGLAETRADRILRQRLAQAKLALARLELGETLSPAEEVLLEDLPRDPLLTARKADIHLVQLEFLIREERIREHTRRLVRRLPGAGRGTIDPVEESAHDVSRVMMNAAGEVVGGPRSRLAQIPLGLKFAAYAIGLGFVVGGIEQCLKLPFHLYALASRSNRAYRTDVFQNYLNLYTRCSAPIARNLMSETHWRPDIDAASVRALENTRIRHHQEGRPITNQADHGSWLDPPAIMAVLPETRFSFKKELFFVPFLNFPLFFGGYTALDRGNRKKSHNAMRRAGQRMLNQGTAITHFFGGTRSKTGTMAPPKKGGAHLILDTDSVGLFTTVNGTNRMKPSGDPSHIFFRPWKHRAGLGVHRRVFLRVQDFDHRDLTPDASMPKGVKASKITDYLKDQVDIPTFFVTLEKLRNLAQKGDVMAQADLAELETKLRPGIEFVRQGKLEEARRWGEGKPAAETGGKKKDQGRKTDFDFLVRFTHWWDAGNSQGQRPS